jgi:hypothetical protein
MPQPIRTVAHHTSPAEHALVLAMVGFPTFCGTPPSESAPSFIKPSLSKVPSVPSSTIAPSSLTEWPLLTPDEVNMSQGSLEIDFRTASAVQNQMEEFYRKIGWWKGPNSTPSIRGNVRNFWVNSGRKGASWLIERISRESHIDLLDGVANILADIGQASVEPIIGILGSGRPSRNQAEVLLKALGWIEAPLHAVSIPRVNLESVLERYLDHSDPDIREAALASTHILPNESRSAILRRRRDIEPNSDVLDAIVDILGE